MVRKGIQVSNSVILQSVVNLGEQVQDLKTSVEGKIESAKEDILKEIPPIARAVDKDAETIIKHEKSITRVERHLSLK